MRCPWAVFFPSALLAEGSVPILSQVCTGLSAEPGVIPCGVLPLLPLRVFAIAETEQYNHPFFRLTHFPLANYPLLAKE